MTSIFGFPTRGFNFKVLGSEGGTASPTNAFCRVPGLPSKRALPPSQHGGSKPRARVGGPRIYPTGDLLLGATLSVEPAALPRCGLPLMNNNLCWHEASKPLQLRKENVFIFPDGSSFCIIFLSLPVGPGSSADRPVLLVLSHPMGPGLGSEIRLQEAGCGPIQQDGQQR